MQFNMRVLDKMACLEVLKVSERRHIARLMKTMQYGAGETIAKAGASINLLHIIHSGRVSNGCGGGLGEGDFFGERSLLGHAHTEVGLTALTEVACRSLRH